ncbi:DUF2075 domain-containing protein [Psychrobacter fozii]|uniref:DUF2075 domain-containing protein n=1 Tax=Psychrobacter fozii TaxID=198480 RepID=UPI001918B3C2|nr:DUF2075 domain-containing protein [Psychrobacter fozii]
MFDHAMKDFPFSIKDFPFDHSAANSIKKEAPVSYDYPVVYIIYSKRSKKAYVGETTNITSRISQHLANEEKRELQNIRVVFSDYFNKSTVLDIESNLIQYMQADKQFKLLNGNAGISNHKYYQKDLYHETFKGIWDELKSEKIVKSDLLDIQNSDLFKFSPYKSLSEDQMNAIEQYLHILGKEDIPNSTVFVQGSAGTGKTILAVYLIKLLLSQVSADDLSEYANNKHLIDLVDKVKSKIKTTGTSKVDMKIALVVPMTSLRDTLKKVFRNIHGLSANMVIGPNEAAKSHFDLLIIDEAHRLRRRKNISGYGAFDQTCRDLKLDINSKNSDELEWIMRSSDNQLFFYDEDQSVRPSDIEKERFLSIKSTSTVLELKSQMRVAGGDDYIDFVDRLLKVDKSLQPWKSNNYDLEVFTDMPAFIKALEVKEDEFGLCRVISGYSWEWVSRKGIEPDAEIDGVELFWNRTNKDWVNSTTDMTEMGCIHTTQGYDLNYAGIIFGSDIIYNRELQKIEVIKGNYYDRNGRVGITDDQLHDYIINIYKTIMYRGIKGTYIYCYDENLREYFQSFID